MAFKKATKQVQVNTDPKVAPLLEAGSYYARLVKIVDLGRQTGSPAFPDPKYNMKFVFECMDEFMFKNLTPGTKEDPTIEPSYNEEDPMMDQPRHFDVTYTYNPDGSISEKAHLYPLIRILSKSYRETEVMEEELPELLGRPICLVLGTKVTKSGKNKGKEYNHITGFAPMSKKQFMTVKAMMEQGVPANLDLVHEALFFDLDAPDLGVWGKLTSGWDLAEQNRLRKNLDFAGSALEAMVGAVAQQAKPQAQPKYDEAIPDEVAALTPEQIQAEEAKLEAEHQAKAKAKIAAEQPKPSAGITTSTGPAIEAGADDDIF
jgi:hypothetical protein